VPAPDLHLHLLHRTKGGRGKGGKKKERKLATISARTSLFQEHFVRLETGGDYIEKRKKKGGERPTIRALLNPQD